MGAGTLDLGALAAVGTTIAVPRGRLLLRAGQRAEHAYFVCSGVLRAFSTPKGRDVTFQFFLEGSCVTSFESFRSRTPSRFSLQAIEPSVVIRLRRATVEAATSGSGPASEELRAHLGRRLELYMRRTESLITESALERYVRLRRESPEIVARVHQHYIASYLGITPVTLSRLRRRLSERT